MGASACEQDAADGSSADPAGLPGAHVDAVLNLKKALISIGINVIGDGGASGANGLQENAPQGGVELIEAFAGQAACLAGGADAGAEEALVRVDVANSVEQGLVKERGFDGELAPFEEGGKGWLGDGQGFGAGSRERL